MTSQSFNTEPVFSSQQVFAYLEEKILWIVLNHGIQNTIIEPEFFPKEELERLIEQNPIKMVILTGEGRYFSSGADISILSQELDNIDGLREQLNAGKSLLSYLENLPILTIAAVNGHCMGAGLEIALACDLILASEKAVFSFPEVTLGLLPGMGGTVRLPSKIGRRAAFHMINTGALVSAKEAQETGLVEFVLPSKNYLMVCKEITQGLLSTTDDEQWQFLLSMFKFSLQLPLEERYQLESKYFVDLLSRRKVVKHDTPN